VRSEHNDYSTRGGPMKAISRCLIALVFVSVCFGVTATQAGANPACVSIKAKGIGHSITADTTTAQITGAGLPLGTTAGGPFVVGGAPPVLSLTGPVVFSAKIGPFAVGTLTSPQTGSLNVTNGAFTSSGPITASTGILSGLGGNLTFTGVQNLTTGTFTENVTGQLCARH